MNRRFSSLFLYDSYVSAGETKIMHADKIVQKFTCFENKEWIFECIINLDKRRYFL